jgi:hypothetical protein
VWVQTIGHTTLTDGCPSALVNARPNLVALTAQLLLAENDARLAQIVWSEFQLDLVARDNTDEMLPHLARDVGQYDRSIWKLHTEHRSGQNLLHDPFGSDGVLSHLSDD